jgi:hypothetical protein
MSALPITQIIKNIHRSRHAVGVIVGRVQQIRQSQLADVGCTLHLHRLLPRARQTW